NVQPQTLTLGTSINTLSDLQKLLRTINWIRPLIGISTEDLCLLFKLLEGDSDLSSP
ncbi:POK18 protein, partial [Penelope pileata]|nr:POK18 protein [Penelope pileata]